MTDSIRSIFKILIGVPVIIMVCFAVFNVFAFGLSYFKMLGLSYVVMQTAIENNYIPQDDKSTIENYMDSIETAVLSNIKFTDDTDFNRKQYGESVNVGVEARYNFIWPLTVKEQTSGEMGVEGMNDPLAYGGTNNQTATGWKTNTELKDYRQEKSEKADTNIKIVYIVPGLKYYPDMD